jgi:hypothetical protein
MELFMLMQKTQLIELYRIDSCGIRKLIREEPAAPVSSEQKQNITIEVRV